MVASQPNRQMPGVLFLYLPLWVRTLQRVLQPYRETKPNISQNLGSTWDPLWEFIAKCKSRWSQSGPPWPKQHSRVPWSAFYCSEFPIDIYQTMGYDIPSPKHIYPFHTAILGRTWDFKHGTIPGPTRDYTLLTPHTYPRVNAGSTQQ